LFERLEQGLAFALIAAFDERLVEVLALLQPDPGVRGLFVVLLFGFQCGVGFVLDGFPGLGEHRLEFADKPERFDEAGVTWRACPCNAARSRV